MLSSWVTGTHPPSGPSAGALGTGTKPPHKTEDASFWRASSSPGPVSAGGSRWAEVESGGDKCTKLSASQRV